MVLGLISMHAEFDLLVLFQDVKSHKVEISVYSQYSRINKIMTAIKYGIR
jgi:hypothetical protein